MLEQNWLRKGDLLDQRYRIKKLIKAGGMGAVYQAEDTARDDKVCAVKQMLDRFDNQTERREAIDRFLSEIQVLGSLRHPNIPRVTDHFLDKNSFFFVMEYIHGTDLSTKLKENKKGFPYQQVLEWIIEVLFALEYIHSIEPPVAHRDIKPSNLIERHSDGRILIIDFGIARVVSMVDGYWIGTRGYAPPEQQMGRPDPRSDLYALGAAMHELLTGIKPDTFNFQSLEDLGIPVPDKLNRVLERVLQWNPEDRYPDAKMMRYDLQSIIGYEPDAREEKSESENFTEEAERIGKEAIFPMLKELMERYGNECVTHYLPAHMEYLSFSLGVPVSFELIIKTNEDKGVIEFFEKQGILEKQGLGSVSPSDPGTPEKVREIIDKYVENYELFKSGGGMGIIF